MKLQLLSFRGDWILEQRMKEETNYCDVSHIYVLTFGICRIILDELFPIDLDRNSRLTIIANVEQKIETEYIRTMFKRKEVIEILKKAQHIDSKYERFGAATHQYKLNQPIKNLLYMK